MTQSLSVSLRWMRYVPLNDEMSLHIYFPGLQDEICDLYGLGRHFQSVWITLKWRVHHIMMTGRSLSLPDIPIYTCTVSGLDNIIFYNLFSYFNTSTQGEPIHI